MSDNKTSDVKPFDYEASKDGEDVFKKLLYVWKPAGLAGFGLATVDVMMYSHPKGYLPTLARYVHFTWPLLAGATAFVLTTNLAASKRQRDDKFNWFAGGFLAGSVFGLWRKSTPAGFAVGALCGTLATVKKDCLQNGYTFLTKEELSNPRTSGAWANHDWTLLKDRPKTWRSS